MNKNQLVVFTAAFLVATRAGAIDLGHNINFKAFGTLGLVYSNNDDADYVTNTHAQAVGAGRSHPISYEVDSKLGAQFDWLASETISLSTQILLKKYEDETWRPRIETVFFKYEVVSELDMRVGRIRPSVFNLSDFHDVNFANPWVRPPIEHYTVVPFSYMDGADLLWHALSGEVSWFVQPYIGQVKVDNAWGNTNDAEVAGLNFKAGQGDFTFRAGYAQNVFRVTGSEIEPHIDNLRRLCLIDPVACDLVDEIDSNDSKANYISLGGSWDNGNYFFLGEWSKSELNVDFFPEMQTWYVSGGASIESWTPYITFAKIKDSLPSYTDSTNPFTNMIINGIHNGVMQGQHSISLGVRYDFMPNMALKAQWDHIKTDCKDSDAGTCGGVFANRKSGFSDVSQVADVISLSFDFIY